MKKEGEGLPFCGRFPVKNNQPKTKFYLDCHVQKCLSPPQLPISIANNHGMIPQEANSHEKNCHLCTIMNNKRLTPCITSITLGANPQCRLKALTCLHYFGPNWGGYWVSTHRIPVAGCRNAVYLRGDACATVLHAMRSHACHSTTCLGPHSVATILHGAILRAQCSMRQRPIVQFLSSFVSGQTRLPQIKHKSNPSHSSRHHRHPRQPPPEHHHGERAQRTAMIAKQPPPAPETYGARRGAV